MTLHEGLLLVGHGTRDPRGQAELFEIARQVGPLCPRLHVEPCFLELAQPSIAEGIQTAYRAGVRRLRVMPLLLFTAGHARNDIPDEVARGAATCEGLELIDYLPPLECHPAVLWLSELRYRQAIRGLGAVPADETMLVMIGRGSGDAEAAVEMHRFAALRRERTPVGALQVGFLAIARPTLDEALRVAADSACRRVVVQPHLLFQGQLVDEIRAAAGRVAAAAPAQQWVVTPHLGAGRPVARAVADHVGCLRLETIARPRAG